MNQVFTTDMRDQVFYHQYRGPGILTALQGWALSPTHFSKCLKVAPSHPHRLDFLFRIPRANEVHFYVNMRLDILLLLIKKDRHKTDFKHTLKLKLNENCRKEVSANKILMYATFLKLKCC